MELVSAFVCTALISFGVLCVRRLRRSHILVNCWFCNLNSSVPVRLTNKWRCHHCDQYNGFQQDGDYNCDIITLSNVAPSKNFCINTKNSNISFDNGLCPDCNNNQEKKIALLSSFQPINASNFDEEIENFRENLERAYRLCGLCESVLEEALSKKKTLVLASNLDLTGSKTGYRNQGYHRKQAMKVVSFFMTALAVIVAFFFSTPFYFSLFPTSESVHSTFQSIFLASSQCLPVVPFIVPALEVCPTLSKYSRTVDPLEAPTLNNLYINIASNPFPLAVCLSFFHSFFTIFYGKSRILTFVCLSQVLILVLQCANYGTILYIQEVQVIVSWIIAFLCILRTCSKKSRLATPFKRLGSTSKKTKIHKTSNFQCTVEDLNNRKLEEAASNYVLHNTLQDSTNRNAVSQFPGQGEVTTFALSNYLTLPTKSPDHQDILSANVADEKQSSTQQLSRLDESYDQHSSASQEDARSDASVDSAFSNADSAILECGDVGSSSAFSTSTESCKGGSQDLDVHSLISSLNLGSSQSKLKKTHAFMTRRYGKSNKRPSLLKPSVLDVACDNSWNNSCERNRTSFCAFEPVCNGSLKTRSISPTESLHSEVTQSSIPTHSAFVPSMAPSWGTHPSVSNTLPVSVQSQLPYAAFGTHTLFTNPQFPHIVYSSYGLNQQPFSPIWNPSVFSMSSHSSPLFSPLSTSRPSKSMQQKNRTPFKSSFEFESDDDADVSFVSQRSSCKVDANLSSSFIDSVWQSRSVIIYTTACYAAVGCAVLVFYHKKWMIDVFSAIPFF